MADPLAAEELFAEHTPAVAATAGRLRDVLLEGCPSLDERVLEFADVRAVELGGGSRGSRRPSH